MRLTVVLEARCPAALRELATRVSDPASREYAQHLDRDALARLVALPDDDGRALISWLADHEIPLHEADDDVNDGRRRVFTATARSLEAALGEATARELLAQRYLPPSRCRDALPRRLAGLVSTLELSPDSVDRWSAPIDFARDLPLCGAAPAASGMRPRDVARGYGFDDATDGRGETIAILALGGVPRLGDLQAFWRAHAIAPPDVHLVRVGPLGTRADHPLYRFETTMAIAWAGALAPAARLVVYVIDPACVADPWSAFLLAVLADTARAPTIAVTTWSCPERQYYRVHGGDLFRGLLDQAAAIGVTVIAATGDWGAYDGMPASPAANGRVIDAPWPHASFPAVESRVLAVGGTRVLAIDPWSEAAWSAPVSPALREALALDGLAGGGGFSDHVAIPEWQRAALAPFHPRSGGAPSVVPYGRGVPDVALMAWGEPAAYQCFLDGEPRDDAGGTSTAAPIWAAIAARLNQRRREQGLGRVGCAQPLFYRFAAEAPEVFRAITEGATDMVLPALDGSGARVPVSIAGYRAREGWNPATGLGVPRV
ncbi:MAG: protease pro-enzyme activation domain-containing protein, partial [Byssovorax sp.]